MLASPGKSSVVRDGSDTDAARRHAVCNPRRAMGELGTFRSATGELIRCRLDWSGRLVAFREVEGAGDRLVPCDPRALLGAVKLSDDPEWLSDHRLSLASAAPSD